MGHKGKKKQKKSQPAADESLNLLGALGQLALGATRNANPVGKHGST